MCMMPEKHLSQKYKLIKVLNQGPYGAKVYQARDTITGESVAVKALRATNTTSLEIEIQAMTRLDHPNIIKLVEMIANDGEDYVYIVTELAKCGDLFEKVAAKGRFSEDISRHYFHQLISAVKHCHSHGVFHRDIKPENILLDDKWRLKLSDFGLSGVWPDDSDHPGPARFWDPCGTVEYAAPEVMVVGKCGYEGAKADVWSCGVVLYVLTTGFLPFEGNVGEMWRKMMRRELKVPKWISPGLKWLLLRMLDPNPETRIDIDEILEDGWFSQGYDLEDAKE